MVLVLEIDNKIIVPCNAISRYTINLERENFWKIFNLLKN